MGFNPDTNMRNPENAPLLTNGRTDKYRREQEIRRKREEKQKERLRRKKEKAQQKN